MRRLFLLSTLLAITGWLTARAGAQTAGTGAITGIVTDPSGAVVAGARITVTNEATGAVQSAVTTGTGNFVTPLLPPGQYRVEVSKEGFKLTTAPNVMVNVTETKALNLQLQVGAPSEVVQVDANAEQLQTETSALGNVTTSEMVQNLPLVTRNYTQILALSPGVAANVTNAGAIGRGGGGSSSEQFSANGGSGMDNNFQMNGVQINDLQQSGSFSGGVAIPNPDTIQEFKVQTGQYDASYGRNAGANVNVVTKTGSNQFHGTVFEYLRNDALNANEFFRNKNGQSKPVLKQNQFGFTLGGPIKRDKLLFFISYQGTRQRNGVDSNCSSGISRMVPLTDDRSRAALGRLASAPPWNKTYLQALGVPIGTNVAPDGSNISDQALALLNRKTPDGQYLVPSAQTVTHTADGDFGSAAFSVPCPFTEDQFMTNGDWQQSDKSKLALRFFFANSNSAFTLPGPNLGGPGVPGFPQDNITNFRNLSLTHTYTFNNSLLNQATLGYNRQFTDIVQNEAFHYSDIGVSVPAYDNEIPMVRIDGLATLGGNGQGVRFAQNTYIFNDDLAWTKGRHSFRFGGGIDRGQNNETAFHYIGALWFGSFTDFLLGQDSVGAGTEPLAPIGLNFSNVLASLDLPGLFDRAWRVWNYNVYAQDDFKVGARLTVNAGFRFEHLGDLGDRLGRNASFDPPLVDPNPVNGSLKGFVVSNNYPGTVPAGVSVVDTDLGIRGEGQNTLNPRVGFAWQVPPWRRMVLRGGYGVYHQRVTGQPLFQLLLNQPFSYFRQYVGGTNAKATFANPFPLPPPTLPSFTQYSFASALSGIFFAQDFRPPLYQRYSLNLQTEIARDFVWEVGYVGTRGTRLMRMHLVNQAGLASPAKPIRGETTNTVANIGKRVPMVGWTTVSTFQIESAGASWYNALTTSLNKRFSHGLQFLASYTFARDLATEVGGAVGGNGGIHVGDQTDPLGGYGPDSFIRAHRFVFSYVYQLPFFRNDKTALGSLLGGWRVSGVTAIQSGHLLPVTNYNLTSVYGTAGGYETDFAQLASGCTLSEVNTSGPVTGKLNNYIKQSCFTDPPVIGDDGVATGFGNTRPGIIHGPAQSNTDISIAKQFGIRRLGENTKFEFVAQFFNAFNTPQFSDPDNFRTPGSSTFGTVATTAVAPRIMQFALKVSF